MKPRKSAVRLGILYIFALFGTIRIAVVYAIAAAKSV